MKLITQKDADPNYLATVVKCPHIKDHPNADRLSIVEIFGNEIIIQKGTYKQGETLIYFPVECCIDKRFLSWANLLEDSMLNRDFSVKGFFGKQCRVKAIKLREIPSQGFVFKASKLAEFYGVDESIFSVGKEFDTVGDNPVLVTKYVRPTTQVNTQSQPNKYRKTFSKIVRPLPRPIRKKLNQGFDKVESWIRKPSIQRSIIGDQFSFHYKTEQLGKNVFLLQPSDIITVSEKLHGASAIYSNLKCRKRPNPFRKLFGIPDTEYRMIYSSRNRIKNSNLPDDSIWGKIAEEIGDRIPEDHLVYGELIGYSSNNKCIQKNYDYGLDKGIVDFRVYRVVRIIDGEKYEFDSMGIIDFCSEYQLETVPIHYYGEAKDLFDIPVDESWRDNFLVKLKEQYFHKVCPMCLNDVVNEGVVVRIETNIKRPAFKFKNPDFVIKESASRDNGEEDMEEDN